MRLHFLFILLWIILIGCNDEKSFYTADDFNWNWKFKLDDKIDYSDKEVDDSSWRTVHIPHDWSIEFTPDSINGEGCTAYLMGGIGWYRKHFITHANPDETTYLIFDGVYNNSEVFLNGKKIGERPYGYVPFYFDLKPHLVPKSQENVLVVKVDHSRYADSRWYSGSGIYRKVALEIVPEVHIPVWGIFASTPDVNDDSATVQVNTQILNTGIQETSNVRLNYKLIDPSGKIVANAESQLPPIDQDQKHTVQDKILVDNPQLWDTENPLLYKLQISLMRGDDIVQEREMKIGIRSFRFDPDEGFYLNGENMKIKGVCLHHDAGLVGAAVPKGVWKRRLTALKEGGCNAIRISHNPGSQEFLDLCDELGFLVQDEFFDEWDYPKDKRLNMWEQNDDYITRGYTEHFQKWAEKDLKNVVRAHRNHPSIFQWSIGNEIEWTYPRNRPATGFFDNMNWEGNYFWSQPPFSPEKIRFEYKRLPTLEHNIGETAQKLAGWTRELDTTRPIIANCILPSASYETGYADALDIIGYSYRRVMYDYGKKHYPQLPIMGTENLGQYHEWKAVMDRPFISGMFLWTGIDYLGESHKGFPRKATQSGLLDLGGFKKPSYHMMKSLWNSNPHIYMSTQNLEKSIYKLVNGIPQEKKPGAWEKALWVWYNVNEHWNYKSEEMVIVEVISNCPEVELFLNGESAGIKNLQDFPDRIYKWAIPYQKGTLEAKGSCEEKEVSTSLVSTGDPTQYQVLVDKSELIADREDVAHIIVQLVDEAGNPVTHINRKVTFEVNGPLKSLGVDNGSSLNVDPYQSDNVMTNKGKALLIVQSTLDKGRANITVFSEGLETAHIELEIK